MRVPATQVIEHVLNGNARRAMEVIQECSKERTLSNQYAAFKNVRSRMMRDSRFWRHEAKEELLDLSRDPTLSNQDKSFLEFLATRPYHTIQWAISKPSLSNPIINSRIRNLRLFVPQFYEFEVPTNLVQQSNLAYQQVVENRHNYIMPDPQRYVIPEEDQVKMVEEAVAYITRTDIDWRKKSNALRGAECLCLLTGRRKSEILFSLQMKSSSLSDYAAQIRGLAKRFSDDLWRTIPLLAPVDIVLMGISKVRLCTNLPRKTYQTKSLWPGKTHTHFRNAFVDMAYKNRSINKFRPQPCSALSWKAAALCVEIGTLASHYQIMSSPIDSDHVQSKRFGEQCQDLACEDG